MPLAGGLAEQPYGLLRVMAEMRGFARDYQTWKDKGTETPTDVESRVLRVIAHSLPD